MRSVRPHGAARPRPARTPKQRGSCAGHSERVSGGRAAALLLVGVLIGGISGGATAADLPFSATESPGHSAPISGGPPGVSAPAASTASAAEEIVGGVQN